MKKIPQVFNYIHVDGIPGWCDFTNFYQLMAVTIPNGKVWCEVGVWLGSSAIFLAKALLAAGKPDVKIVCVDSWKGGAELESVVKDMDPGTGLYELFWDNVKTAGVENMIIPVTAESVDAAKQFPDGHFWGVFIDACHESEMVKADLEAWAPKVSEHGMFCGHDWSVPAVCDAVTAFAQRAGKKTNHLHNVWFLK